MHAVVRLSSMENSVMGDAWIAGKPATLETAIAEAAALLAASRQALIAGLGTDIAGARAAIALAERTGAVIDHMHSDALLRDLDVIRSSGVMLTTPSETYVRADTLLVVGPMLEARETELLQRLFEKLRNRQRENRVERRIFWLCPGAEHTKGALGAVSATTVGKEPKELPALAAALRARMAGRPTGKAPVAPNTLDEVLAGLKASRFGVAIWQPETLDELTIEMMCGLVNDLNATTRFSTLPLPCADNAIGILQTCGWMTGMPMRTGFGRGFPEHDPWRFDGTRLVESGETDCVVWISAYRAHAPHWRDPPPIIALTGRKAGFPTSPRVHIEVGRPGIDHAAVVHQALTGTLTAVDAMHPSDAISTAEAIQRISSALPEGQPS
jgi:formylmethanofuran dehydrogenase subunit B